MKVRLQLLIVAISIASHLVGEASSQAASCNCRGTVNGGVNARQYICRDSRLGPIVLPRRLPLASFVSDYHRFGGLTPGEFLQRWYVNGSFEYPEQNGFQLDTDGSAINGTMVIQNGTLVDRFGSEYGTYISAADAPYSQRSLPPANLDTNPSAPDYPYNYHIYRVVKPLTVLGGPIAPWFGQPGLGTQFYTGSVGNVLTLISSGYLERVNTTELIAGSAAQGCGQSILREGTGKSHS